MRAGKAFVHAYGSKGIRGTASQSLCIYLFTLWVGVPAPSVSQEEGTLLDEIITHLRAICGSIGRSNMIDGWCPQSIWRAEGRNGGRSRLRTRESRITYKSITLLSKRRFISLFPYFSHASKTLKKWLIPSLTKSRLAVVPTLLLLRVGLLLNSRYEWVNGRVDSAL